MKRKVAIALNAILVLLEIIGVILTVRTIGYIDVAYYTEDSNLLSLVISVIFLVYLLKGKVPKYVSIIKYMSVLCLMVTFLVVLFILGPMYNFNYQWLFFTNDLIFFHLLCPIVAFVSFVFFEEHEFDRKDSLRACYFTFIYAIILVILNIVDVVEGPYPFLMVRKQSIIMSLVWGIVIVGGSYILALGIRKLKSIFYDKV